MAQERKGPDQETAIPQAGPSGRIVESEALLGEAQELLIRHEGRLYRLRRTRLGKLILTA